MLILGVDAGTSIVKCALFDLQGEEVSVIRKEVDTIVPRVGWAEQDMDLIRNTTIAAVRDAVRESERIDEKIGFIGITGQTAGTFLIDSKGRGLKAILWRDIRAESTIRRLGPKVAKEFQKLSGWPLLPQFITTQMTWLKENEPETLDAAANCISCIDWIAHSMTGNLRAVSTGMIACIDPSKRVFDERIFDLMGLGKYTRLLPELIEPWEVVGEVTNVYSSKTGIRAGTPVVSAGYDQTCNTLGAGATERGQAVTILGTAGGNSVVVDRYAPALGSYVACTPHAIPGRWIALAESLTATPNLDWFIAQFCGEEKRAAEKERRSVYEVCDDEAAKVPPGAGGVVYLPYLFGEVSPFFNAAARAGFFGVGGLHTKADLLRAVYEGVGFAIRSNYESIKDSLGVAPMAVTLAGGGSKSATWRRVISDMNGVRVNTTGSTELGAKGAAICAAVALKLFRSHAKAVEAMVKLEVAAEPDKSNRGIYDKGYGTFTSLSNSLGRLWVA
jgi:sugar (pentulose or hexulose) kinase